MVQALRDAGNPVIEPTTVILPINRSDCIYRPNGRYIPPASTKPQPDRRSSSTRSPVCVLRRHYGIAHPPGRSAAGTVDGRPPTLDRTTHVKTCARWTEYDPTKPLATALGSRGARC